jgi:hypothetical protein
MTILEALEKAKRLREIHGEAASRQASRTSAPKVARRQGTHKDLAPAAPIQLPQLSLDIDACERNRVLLSTHHAHKFSATVAAHPAGSVPNGGGRQGPDFRRDKCGSW